MKILIDSSTESNDENVQCLENKSIYYIVHVQYRKVYTLKSNTAAAKRERDVGEVCTSTSRSSRTRVRLGDK